MLQCRRKMAVGIRALTALLCAVARAAAAPPLGVFDGPSDGLFDGAAVGLPSGCQSDWVAVSGAGRTTADLKGMTEICQPFGFCFVEDKAACDAAGANAHEPSSVEAHGTGTALGDPIEMGSMADASSGASCTNVSARSSVDGGRAASIRESARRT